MIRARHAQDRWLVVVASGFLLGSAAAWAQDSNSNSVLDSTDISGGPGQDCNTNGVPEECDISVGRALEGTTTRNWLCRGGGAHPSAVQELGRQNG